MYPFYLGIDLHLKRSYLVLMNAEGEVIDKRHLKNTEMAAYISKNIPKETYAVMEATRNWPFFYDLLEKHVDRVELGTCQRCADDRSSSGKDGPDRCLSAGAFGKVELSTLFAPQLHQRITNNSAGLAA